MAVPNRLNLVEDYHKIKGYQFNLRTREGCGLWTEGFVTYANPLDHNIGHLKKYGAQTQYNGHAVDAICYYDPSRGTYQSVDLIFASESEDPNEVPKPVWVVQEVYYTSKDWYLIESSLSPKVVPWVGYDENGFNNRVQKQLSYDYSRRPQVADFAVSVWSARVFHSAYMGPEGVPLGMDGAIKKHRPEWCASLGVSVDEVWF